MFRFFHDTFHPGPSRIVTTPKLEGLGCSFMSMAFLTSLIFATDCASM